MPVAARLTDPIQHSNALTGLLIGAAAGLAFGVFVVATGGAGLVVGAAIIGGSVCAGAGIGELIGSLDMTNSLVGGTVTGAIASGSGDTKVNSLPAARATDDIVQCAGTPPLYLPSHPGKRIAQGSGSVFINSQPAARISDKIECGAEIQMGSPNVVFGGPTVTTLEIDSEVPGWIHGALFVIGIASAVVLAGPVAAALGLVGGVAGGYGGSWLGGKIFGEGSDGQKIMGFLGAMAGGALGTKLGSTGRLGSWNQAGKCKLGLEPIDLGSGAVVDHKVDLALPGAIAFTWERRYHSAGSGRTGPLGRGGWTHSLDQWVSREAGQTTLRDDEGRDVYFPALAPGQRALHRADRVELTALEGGVFEAYHLGSRLTRTFTPLREGERAVLTSVRDAWGNAVALAYQGDDLATITDTAGRQIRVTHGLGGRVVRVEVWAEGALQTWVSYGYAEAGELCRVTDALGYEERYAYDGARRMVQKTLKNGVSFYYDYDDRTGWCKRSYGDGGIHAGDIAVDLERRITYLTGNDEPRVIHFNEDGLAIREETPDGVLIGTWEYDNDLYLIAEANGAGEARRYTYDARGNKTSETDPAGNVTRWEHKNDREVAWTAPNGRTTTYRYDARGALVELVASNGRTYGFGHDPRGHLITFADLDGPIRRYEHSDRHDLIAETLEGGERLTYEHDALGRVKAFTDASGGKTTITYDRRGRPLAVTRPDGTTTRRDYGPYDDILARHTDALGQGARLDYTGTGMLERLTDAKGAVWELLYTSNERLKTVKNPRGEEHTFVYDTAGRIVEERTFDGLVTRYRYEASGRLAAIEHPDGDVRRFSYDALGNVTRDEAPGSVITYQRGATGHAWRITLEDEGGEPIVTDLGRDTSGRVVIERTWDREVQSTYDDRDRRVTRALHDGAVTRYVYEGGALARVSHGDHHVVFAHDMAARATSVTSGAARIESRFDAMNRLLSQDVRSSKALLTRRYRYDDHGRLNEVEDDRWGATSYTYDPTGHLLSASRRRWRELMDYDATGAIRRMIGGLSPSSDAPWDLGPGGAVKRAGGVTFDYDARGRRARRRGADGEEMRYRWDSRDRLREVIRSNGERVLMTYDAFGRRIRKEVRSPSGDVRTTDLVWDGAAIAAEITPDRGTRAFVFVPGTLAPLLQTEAGQVLTYVNDHAGTPKDLLSPSGEVVWSASHSAWGAVTEVRQTPLNGRTFSTPIRMLGHAMDDETGLACSLFRYLDPSIGAWCSRDPLGVFGGANPFAWGRSPTNVVDPFGLSNYFRADDGYRGGPIGYPLGSDAAAGADVQTPWQHVDDKQGNMTSRYTSFSEELASVRPKFGDRAVKVKISDLQTLQDQGQIRILKPEDVRAAMEAEGMSKKEISGIMQQMKNNKEILVEGEIPENMIKGCK